MSIYLDEKKIRASTHRLMMLRRILWNMCGTWR